MLSLISPLPLLTLSSSIISARAPWILQSYLKGLSCCCMKIHIKKGQFGDSSSSVCPNSRWWDTNSMNSLPATLSVPIPLLKANSGILFNPVSFMGWKSERDCNPNTPEPCSRDGKAGWQRLLIATASRSFQQNYLKFSKAVGFQGNLWW